MGEGGGEEVEVEGEVGARLKVVGDLPWGVAA
jgi:hypothetical protein